jgi:hypothetical protein
MSMIMCSRRMWRVVRQWERTLRTERTSEAVLGPWAATTFAVDGRELVLAVEASTHLTIAFALAPSWAFHEGFARSVEFILQDIDVPPARIALEIARVRSARLTRLHNPELGKALRTLEFMCGIELEYHSELRRVQANLSEFPHAPPPHYVAVQNARWLFAHRQSNGR